MALLRTIKFNFSGLGGEIRFSLKVNVNKEGLFTAYYPEEVQKFLTDRFILLNYGRASKSGYLESKSLQEIIDYVNIDFNKALECKLLKEYVVIKYKLRASAGFCLDSDNNIHPDGSNCEAYWYSGKTQIDASHKKFYGINIYAKLWLKKEFKTINGIKSQYEWIGDSNAEDLGKEADTLQRWRCQHHDEVRDENLEELIYTEENAKFFNTIFFNIAKMTMKIDKISEPKRLIQFIKAQNKLLTLES